MFLAYEQVNIIGKGRKSGESSAKTRNQQHIHRRRDEICLLDKSKKNTYNKGAHDIDNKSTERKGRDHQQMAKFTSQKSQRGAQESTQACNNHRFKHNRKGF